MNMTIWVIDKTVEVMDNFDKVKIKHRKTYIFLNIPRLSDLNESTYCMEGNRAY